VPLTWSSATMRASSGSVSANARTMSRLSGEWSSFM